MDLFLLSLGWKHLNCQIYQVLEDLIIRLHQKNGHTDK